MPNFSFRQKQIASFVLTFAVYTWLINWQAALLLMVGVGFHECSHLWAAKRMKLKTSGFFLIPFMGGVALVAERYKTYGQQAFVVILGPVGSGLLAVATAVAYHFTGYNFLGAAAEWMCFLNLFNLLPLSFLDGGQLMDTITYSINRNVGFVVRTISTLIAVVLLWFLNPVLTFVVAFFGGTSLLHEYQNWKHYRAGNLYLCSPDYIRPPRALTGGQVALTIVGWIVTAIVLVATTAFLKQDPANTISTILHK